MKRVLLRGPILTQSGYGVHSRQVARWLLSKNNIDLTIQATPWGLTPWLLDHEDKQIARIMSRCKQLSPSYDVSFQVQLPNEWSPDVATYNVGITAAVETDRCNPQWVQACSQMNAVVVPSTHAKNSLEHYGPLDNVRVIPESFPDSILEVDGPQIDLGELSTDFNFLIFGQITGNNPENDRKNLFHTLRVFCDAFADNPDVGLVIKTNSGKSTKIDKKITKVTLSQVLGQVRRGPYPRVHFIHGSFTDAEIASLYRHQKIKALVTLTRGEGFGLPILEAAASALPVIATNWSAYLDFMNKGKFIGIDYSLAEIHPSRCDENIFMKGARWANINEDDFKKKILKFYQKSDKPKQWAADLAEIIRSDYSFSSIASIYDINFGDLVD